MNQELDLKKKRRRSPLLIAVFVLLALALFMCAAVGWLWWSGRNSMNKVEETPTMPTHEVADSDGTGDYLHYNGKRYVYNESMTNILLLGIDSTELPGEAIVAQDQADVIVLAALDKQNDKMTLINIPRDTMCDIDLSVGHDTGNTVINAQLALAYAMESDSVSSCELTRDTVSNLFFGLPIQGYGAYYMSGIGELNDAVGGVTITVLGDIGYSNRFFGRTLDNGQWKQDYWLKRLVDGNTITLTSYEAGPYLQYRDSTSTDSNEMRMKRQKQYMLGLLSAAKEKFISDPTSVLTMYEAVDDYLVTNLNLNSISYLATIAAKMSLSPDILSLTGEYVLNEATSNAELYIDQQALQELMLEVFYTEVP